VDVVPYIGGIIIMEYNLDKMMGLDKLELYYESHMAGIDGENFSYSIYLEDNNIYDKFIEVSKAITEFIKPYDDKDIYMGYIDITKDDEKVSIYLDLGNVEPQYEDVAIKGILKALNDVQGIKSVIINEGCDFDF
jgi:hypothetical protein